MPADFDKCEKDGGKIITHTIDENRYMHICYPKGGGKSISGEVKTKLSARDKVRKGLAQAEKK
jgi:hypothetical protein